jgi:hypothetical protein
MNLSQIAKQVSLVNRLIELLRMQEEPSPRHLGNFGWSDTDLDAGTYYRHIVITKSCISFESFDPSSHQEYTFQEAWNHQLTQKAWSDELVRVAREYLETFTNSENYRIEEHFVVNVYGSKTIPDLVYEICKGVSMDTLSSKLEAILNKYGRSLIE